MRSSQFGAVLALTLMAGGAFAQAGALPLGHKDFLPSPAHPVGWRGDGSGVFPGATPVTTWDGPTGKNILWKVEMPHVTYSSPIVVGNKVITEADPSTVLCLDADTGKVLWTQAQDQLDILCKNPAEAKQYRHLWDVYCRYFSGIANKKLTPAQEAEKAQARQELEACGVSLVGGGRDGVETLCHNPYFTKVGLWLPLNRGVPATLATPVSDGQRVWTLFNSNTAACYDLADGKVLWMRWLGEVTKPNLIMSSPLLADGVLVVFSNFVMRGLDAESGKILWEQPYTMEGCHYSDGSNTPVLMTLDGKKVVATWNGWLFDVKTGTVLHRKWSKYAGARYNRGNSPFLVGPDLLVTQGISNKPATRFDIYRYAVAADGATDELVGTATPRTFEDDDGTSVYYDGYVYFNDGWDIYDVKAGKTIARTLQMPSGGYSGICVAGKYLFNFDPVASAGVATLGPDGAVVAINHLLPGKTHTTRIPGKGNRGIMSKACDAAFWQHVFAQRDAGIIGWVGATESVVLGEMTADPFFQGDRIYVRTYTHLICIGPKA